MDEIAPHIPREMVIQKGYSRYRPKNVNHFDFVSLNEAMEYLQKSELVVSHAGIGTIILCKQYGIPILIFPRKKAFQEHMNDHQLEIAKALETKESGNIYVIYEEDQLEEKILKVLRYVTKHNPNENIGRRNLIGIIREFIETDQ